MNWSMLKSCDEWNQAPVKGYCLAYCRRKVFFEPYSDIEEVEKICTEESGELLELHLFDSNREFRAVATESARFQTGMICHIAEFPENSDVYREDTELEKVVSSRQNRVERLTVLNHLCFREGMAYVDDYRLCVEGI